jgi:hypothetical protein
MTRHAGGQGTEAAETADRSGIHLGYYRQHRQVVDRYLDGPWAATRARCRRRPA